MKGANWMLVSTYYTIGNMTVPSSWIALIIAFVIAYMVVRKKFDKRHAEKFSDLIFTFIIVWKLSVVLTQFETVIHSPLSILYFNGGRIGVFLALLTVGGIVLVDVYLKRLIALDLRSLFMGFVSVQALYPMLMIMLNKEVPMMAYVSVVIMVAFALYMVFVIKKVAVLLVYWVLLFAAVHLFSSALLDAGITGTSVLSTLVISLFFVAGHVLVHAKGRELVE